MCGRGVDELGQGVAWTSLCASKYTYIFSINFQNMYVHCNKYKPIRGTFECHAQKVSVSPLDGLLLF